MDPTPESQQPAFVSSLARTKGGGPLRQLFGVFSSVQMAAGLIAVLALVVGAATTYEVAYGAEVTGVMIYQSSWFNLLFLLLAITILGAALTRLPWRRHHVGFVVVHTGLLTLMVGFTLSAGRLDGHLECRPDQLASRIDLPTDQVTLISGSDQLASPPFQPIAWAGYPSLARFAATPLLPVSDIGIVAVPDRAPQWLSWLRWPSELVSMLPGPGEPILVDPARQLSIRVVAVCDWAANGSGWASSATGVPVARVRLAARMPGMPGTDLQPMSEGWLTPSGESSMSEGPVQVTLSSSTNLALVEDFLQCRPDLPATGRLTAYWAKQRFDIALEPGREQRLAEDLAITVVRLIANPGRTADGLEQVNDAPLNPLVELSLSMGSGDQLRTESMWVSAFQLLPASGQELPEVLYDHPVMHIADATARGAYAQLLVGPDDLLRLRWFTRSRGLGGVATVADTWQGTLVGSATAPMQVQAQVDWLARAEPAPIAVAANPRQRERLGRWLRLMVRQGELSGEGWIQRGQRRSLTLTGANGQSAEVLLGYGRASYDLAGKNGFSVRLDRFDHGKDPGGMMSASYSSEVALIHADGKEEKHLITMNEPLQWHGDQASSASVARPYLATLWPNSSGLTLYQTSFFPESDAQGRPTGRDGSVFTVATDPGRALKYLGSAILVAGILILYWQRRSRAPRTLP